MTLFYYVGLVIERTVFSIFFFCGVVLVLYCDDVKYEMLDDRLTKLGLSGVTMHGSCSVVDEEESYHLDQH